MNLKYNKLYFSVNITKEANTKVFYFSLSYYYSFFFCTLVISCMLATCYGTLLKMLRQKIVLNYFSVT